jgi:hypothetical protein
MDPELGRIVFRGPSLIPRVCLAVDRVIQLQAVLLRILLGIEFNSTDSVEVARLPHCFFLCFLFLAFFYSFRIKIALGYGLVIKRCRIIYLFGCLEDQDGPVTAWGKTELGRET